MRVLPINLMVSLMVSRRSRESDAIMGLTAVAIKAAKGRAKDYKLADSDGLYLLVKPNGGRYWRMNYRFRGFQKTLAFGAPTQMPSTSIASSASAAKGGAIVTISTSAFGSIPQPINQ
jgi:Arm DNA-binding domain